MEPVVVNTVSYFKESAEIETRASGVVIKLSFLQESKKSRMEIEKIPMDFISVKNKTKRSKKKM